MDWKAAMLDVKLDVLAVIVTQALLLAFVRLKGQPWCWEVVRDWEGNQFVDDVRLFWGNVPGRGHDSCRLETSSMSMSIHEYPQTAILTCRWRSA